MSNTEFRKELLKLMPGYLWTIHKTTTEICLKATGTQSSGSNRISTLLVIRTEREGKVSYEAKSSGYGLRAHWLHTCTDKTLARALRCLQDHYEAMEADYRGHANALQSGRKNPSIPQAEQKEGAA